MDELAEVLIEWSMSVSITDVYLRTTIGNVLPLCQCCCHDDARRSSTAKKKTSYVLIYVV